MFGIRKRIQAKQSRLRQLFTDTQSLVKLAPLDLGYVPWTTYAVKPTVMTQIVNDIVVNDRRSIVEFGCGISTVHLARLAQQRASLEGRATTVTSIEDDAGWAEVVRGMLRERNLEDYARIVVAPLRSCSFSADKLEWYDEECVNEALAGLEQIDLVFVDGPKACDKDKGLARFPALRAVWSRLGSRCAIILDDIARPGEQRVLELWRNEPGFDLKVSNSGLCAVCHRGSFFVIW